MIISEPIMDFTVGGSARQGYLFQAGSIEKDKEFYELKYRKG